VRARSVTLSFEQDGFRRATGLSFNRKGELKRNRASFEVRIEPQGKWKLCIDLTPIEGVKPKRPLLRCDSFGAPEPEMPLTLQEWLDQAPELEANDDLRHVYHGSLVDLAALRIRPREEGPRWAMPAGSVPWFLTVFGRDSLIASYQALPFQPTLARATLETLAELQAAERDDFRDAEPGKILHGLRRGKLVALGLDPHGPYYGTHDATQLFLILLDEYERWTADTAFVRRLEPNARQALEWIDEEGDLDGDGFLEYESRSAKGLQNHRWKDSDGAIQFADGRPAHPPIATCEIQGYTYDARSSTTRAPSGHTTRRSAPRACDATASTSTPDESPPRSSKRRSPSSTGFRRSSPASPVTRRTCRCPTPMPSPRRPGRRARRCSRFADAARPRRRRRQAALPTAGAQATRADPAEAGPCPRPTLDPMLNRSSMRFSEPRHG
jgi:glycogen debranching enzyme